MNFTREPIIETIISPRDGFKLLVRNSKGGETEEYLVDALEVVSFGQAFFLRSLERPKSFLVPANDYEVVEVKEARMALKTISHEKNIKIGGGRDASIRGGQPPAEKEPLEVVASSEEEMIPQEGVVGSQASREPRSDRRRDRRRHRRRRGDEQWPKSQDASKEGAVQGETTGEEPPKVSPPIFSGLFPPPSSLISETIGRYKGQEFFDKDRAEKKQTPPPEEPPVNAEGTTLSRVSVQTESATLMTTQFLPPSGFDPLF